jgi:hypothetical protein
MRKAERTEVTSSKSRRGRRTIGLEALAWASAIQGVRLTLSGLFMPGDIENNNADNESDIKNLVSECMFGKLNQI